MISCPICNSEFEPVFTRPNKRKKFCSLKCYWISKKGVLSPQFKKRADELRGKPGLMLGKKASEETRKKLSESHKGKATWIKGRTHSPEARRKISLAQFGRVPWNKGKGKQYMIKFGYKFIRQPDHPYATESGYVKEHRLVMEKYLGRYLTQEEVVHHKDHNKLNNSIDNLVLYANNHEHLKAEHSVRK